MTLVVVHTHPIESDQKRRIEAALISVLQKEGFPTSQAMLLFQEEAPDPPETEENRAPSPRFDPSTGISPDFKTRARRTMAELAALKLQLVDLLKANGTLTSFQARQVLGLTQCNWAPPALRRIFSELERQGLVTQQGCKRNTRYAWKGSMDRAH